MKFKKIYRDLKYGVLKPKIFIILFGLFFSSLAFAAALTVTNDQDDRIPPGDANCFTSDLGSGTHQLENDRTEDPMDVAFSEDGSKVFTVNTRQQDTVNLNMNTLSIGFELNAVDTSDELGANNNGKGCDALDAFDHRDVDGVSAGSALNNIKIVDGGKIFFLLTGQQGNKNHNRSGYGSQSAELLKYDLSVPNDFTTASFNREHDFSTSIGSVAFSRDGTKLFALEDTADTPNLTTFSLPGPFDISSLTQIHTVDLASAYDFMTEDGETDKNATDIEFNDTGSSMFIMMNNDAEEGRDLSYIYQFRLGTNYDVSTSTLVGKWNITFANTSTGFGMPQGFTFSSDGMKMFVVQIQSGAGVDEINSYSLECPYGLVECTSDSASSLASQLTLAKQNIALNTSTIFKRFEWVKRNRDSENLNSFNFNFNSDDIILSSLTNKLQHLANTKQISLIKNNKEETKKSKWSYWSHADISIGDYRKTLLEKAQHFRAEGLTLGADKKYGDNKFFGLALRYSDNNNDIKGSAQRTDMESLTLNFYGVIPKDEDQYINAILGLSALRFDQKYLDKLTGERNGKQIFTAINFRSKKNYSGLNITPSGRLTYGLTYFSEYTDFISNVKNAQDVLYDNDHFETGDLAAGFLFNTDEIKYPNGIFITNGGLEFVYDFTPVAELNYSSPGSSNVNIARLDNYSEQNIRGNIGFEFVYLSGFTFSMNYERYQSINSIRNSHTDTLLIKFSHLVDEDNEFAFNFDPLKNNLAQLNYSKNINGFDVRFNTDYNLSSDIDLYGANIEVSNTF